MAFRGIVVGCGGMGRSWMKNLAENSRSELVGVVDIRQEAADKAAADFKLPTQAAFTDLKAAIAALKPDFVCDITIPEAHCPTTVAAHALGIPTIGEKPLADTLKAGREMIAAVQRSGKLGMISQSRRYNDRHVALRNAITDGAVGDITTINCDFYLGAHFGGFRDAMASPLILDMAIHHFDMARFFVSSDAKRVYAHEFNPKESWYAGDVACSVIFELDKSIVFTYRGSWCAEGCHTSWDGNWRVIGTKGTLLLENDQHPHGQRVVPSEDKPFNRKLEDITVPTVTINGTGIAGSLNEFIDALEGKGAPQCLLADNLRSLAMVEAAMESSKQGKKVDVARE